MTPIPAHNDEAECELWSREWELNVSEAEEGPLVAGLSHSLSHCGKPECLLYISLVAVAIPVTSFIVSGSIVVVGNTVHWLEEQGTCDVSMTQEAIDTLVESTESVGGVMVQTGSEFIRWVKRHSGFEPGKKNLTKNEP